MKKLTKSKLLDPYVKEILFIEGNSENKQTKLSFYADGFPGIVFSESKEPFVLQPKNKELSNFYLFGQTIKPISLQVMGTYQLIAFRLYPFAARLLLGVDPKKINDDCYDLHQIRGIETSATVQAIINEKEMDRKVNLMTNYLIDLVAIAAGSADASIMLAVNLIINSQGRLSINELGQRLFITERTFLRNFSREIGVSPKQFSKIIQFSCAKDQISRNDYNTLTEVGYRNGYADQSHFIRAFKKFTGLTPKEYQKQISA